MIVEFWIGTVTNRVPSAYRYFWHRYCRHTDTIPCCRVRASAGAASYRAQHQAPPRVWGQQGRERWQRGQAEAHRHQAPGRGLQQPEVWQRWALNTNNKNVDISFCQVFVRHYYFLHPIQSSHDVGNCRIWKKRVSWKLILGCLDVETGENNNNKAWDQRPETMGPWRGHVAFVIQSNLMRHDSMNTSISEFFANVSTGCFNQMLSILCWYSQICM